MTDRPKSAADFRKQLQAKQAAAAQAELQAELAKQAKSATVADYPPKTMPGAVLVKGPKKDKQKGDKPKKGPQKKRERKPPPQPKFRLPAGAQMTLWQPEVGMWHGRLEIPGCQPYLCSVPKVGDYGLGWVCRQLGLMWWKEHGEKMVVKLDMPPNDPAKPEEVKT